MPWTALSDSAPLVFTADFYDLPSEHTQWKPFFAKSELTADSSLPDVIESMAGFVMPIVFGILQKDTGAWWRNDVDPDRSLLHAEASK